MYSIYRIKPFVEVSYNEEVNPRVINGARELHALCGFDEGLGREPNLLSILTGLDPSKSRLVGSLLATIPSNNSQFKNDDERVRYCVARLSSGTPAEDERWAQFFERAFDLISDSKEPTSVENTPQTSEDTQVEN